MIWLRHRKSLAILSLGMALALVATGCAPQPSTPPAPTATVVTTATAAPPATAAPTATAVATTAPASSASPTAVPKPTIVPITGRTTRAAIEGHTGWEQLRAQDYTPDAAAVATIRDRAKDVEVIVVLGTWCSDTKRELPRFFKIMDQAGLAEAKVTLIGVDRTKKDAEGLAEKWQVQFVPTFIFLRNGQELGRVIEKPKGTLEGDIAQILQASQ